MQKKTSRSHIAHIPASTVLFKLGNSDGPIDEEWVTADQLAVDLFALAGIPGHVCGFSSGDVVRVRWDAERCAYLARTVVYKSGNRTLRVHVPVRGNASNDMQSLLAEMALLGCTIRSRDELVVLVHVPAWIDMRDVSDAMNAHCASWRQADPVLTVSDDPMERTQSPLGTEHNLH